jgi:hypothetical protein
MARPLVDVEIGGRKLIAVLDTGFRRSYIRADLAGDFPTVEVQPFEARLGGEVLKLRQGRAVSGVIKDSEGRAYLFGGNSLSS